MKLHSTTGQPDWHDVPAGQRNAWQRWAARSNGVITPGNFCTALGGLGVAVALWLLAQEAYWSSLAVLALSRSLDVADGWLADQTGTKSPLGELLDATIDKLGTVAAPAAMLLLGVLPVWVALALIFPQLVITGVALLARQKGSRLHPSRTGKLGMAAAWLSLLAFVAARAVPAGWQAPVEAGASGLTVIAAIMAGYNVWEYERQRRGIKSGVS